MSDLELLVMADMYDNGYDPSSKEDIESYWKELLNGN
jgi:hypothetical protein